MCFAVMYLPANPIAAEDGIDSLLEGDTSGPHSGVLVDHVVV